jgi:hypothetical protein
VVVRGEKWSVAEGCTTRMRDWYAYESQRRALHDGGIAHRNHRLADRARFLQLCHARRRRKVRLAQHHYEYLALREHPEPLFLPVAPADDLPSSEVRSKCQ